MKIQELSSLYARQPQVSELAKVLQQKSRQTVIMSGLLASSASFVFASLAKRTPGTLLFIMNDAEDAG